MKLKDIVLAGALFLSSAAFSQNKLHFDIYTQGEGRFSPRLNSSSLKVSNQEVSFSFLLGLYSMEFKKLNDSIYRETVRDIWNGKEEVFEYALRNSHYVFKNYSAIKGQSRAEKEALEGNFFDEKYRSLPELFSKLESGNLGDSVHFPIQGLPYSISIKKIKKGKNIVYLGNLRDAIKLEPGDVFHFPYPVEVTLENNIPSRFSTQFIKVKSGKKTHLEGILRED